MFSSGVGNDLVSLSSRGAARIAALQKMKHNEKLKLRLSVDGGGCSGFQYKFEMTDCEPEEDDLLFEQDGKVLLVDKVSLDFVRGATVDFTEDLIRRSFEVIENPNAETSCGCGSSFAAKGI